MTDPFSRTPGNAEPSGDRPPHGHRLPEAFVRACFEPRRAVALRRMAEHLAGAVVCAALGDRAGSTRHADAAKAYGDVVKLCDAAMGDLAEP